MRQKHAISSPMAAHFTQCASLGCCQDEVFWCSNPPYISSLVFLVYLEGKVNIICLTFRLVLVQSLGNGS